MIVQMIPFKKLENKRIVLILLSSLAFITISTFSGNLVHSAYADFNFAAAGDWGCTSNTDATVSNMDAKDPERVFGLGDYSYASTGTCWFNKIGPIDSIMDIAFGNHEDDSDEGFSGYMSHFGLSQTYYSYNYQDVHVLVMDTDRNSYSSGSAQRTFIQNDLQAASTNPNIKWIIVYLHKPMYTSPNSCGSSSCSNTGSENTNLRNGFHPMFDQYGVDLVLQGHVHNYQRTFTLKYDPGSPSSPTITSNNANTYTEGNGAVFAIIGTGGVNFHALSGKASFTSSQQDDFFGQLDIKSTDNGNRLEGKFYRNGNNAILDSFSITKAVNSPPVANNQAVTAIKNTAKAITLTATDANNNPLTYSIVTQPSHGTLSPSTPGGPSRTYTPAAGYTGPDSFTFKANDGTVDSNTATVTINVIEPPQGSYNYAPSLVLTGSNFQDTPSTSALQLNQFSVAAWFKTSANFGADAWIVNKGGFNGDSAGQNLNYGIWMNSAEQIVAGFETSSGANQFVASVNTYNDNQWHYAVVTNDGTTLRLYVDGIEVATTLTAGASPESSGTKPVRVGANSGVTPPGNFFTGEVDEVRVWNDDLTFQQMADAFAGTSFNTGDQVLYLQFGSPPPVDCTTNVPIGAATASGNDGNVPSNVLDNNLNTRWSSFGVGQFVTADLGSTQNICGVDIAWYLGNQRTYNFVISTSTDGTTFTNKFSGSSSGTTLNSEKYTFASTDARYVRVTVNGNSVNNWASITELDVFGSSVSLTSTYNFEPSLTLSGPP
jgi:Concanavalin A-like lectin/glucanases superfamily/F5/8 type C domain/Bacterial Ig domain/Calcineurin-like phosphoesterase